MRSSEDVKAALKALVAAELENHLNSIMVERGFPPDLIYPREIILGDINSLKQLSVWPTLGILSGDGQSPRSEQGFSFRNTVEVAFRFFLQDQSISELDLKVDRYLEATLRLFDENPTIDGHYRVGEVVRWLVSATIPPLQGKTVFVKGLQIEFPITFTP